MGGQALKPVTGLSLTSIPDPPYSHGTGLFTTFTAHFDADPINHTFIQVLESGFLTGSAYANPGATSILVENASFGSPATVQVIAIRTNSNSRTGWPRSSSEVASNIINVP